MITADDVSAALATLPPSVVRSAPRTTATAVAPTGPASAPGQDSYSQCLTTVATVSEGDPQDVTLLAVIWTQDRGTVARFAAGGGPAPAGTATTTPVAPRAPFAAARFSPTFLGLETWDADLYVRAYVATPRTELAQRQAAGEVLAGRVASGAP